nr:unnamed protein product [Callosobruchus analis]
MINCSTQCNAMGRMLDLVATNIECKVSHDLLPLVREDSYHPALSIVCNIDSRGDSQFDTDVTILDTISKKRTLLVYIMRSLI